MKSSLYTTTNAKSNVNQLVSGEIKLIRGGKEYFDLLLELIATATHSIHLQTYIFDDDETGSIVVEALKNAVGRNVEVYLLVDSYGSQTLSKSFIKYLHGSGVHFKFFEPLFRSKYFYLGRRMHHKVFVVDTRHALVGGINIANRYNDLADHKAWLDFALYVSGDIARELCILCWKTWNGFPRNMGLTPCEQQFPLSNGGQNKNSTVVVRRNDWVRGKNEISKSYIGMLVSAKSEIIILCSYFLPGKIMRRKIAEAIKRGVSVNVVTGRISDVRLSKLAERWLYDWMLRKGVKLYEYQHNVLHGKLALCDANWITVGSYNVNDISAYASIELNLDVHDAAFAGTVRSTMTDLLVNECLRITQQSHIKGRNLLTQFIRWLSYYAVRIIFHLFTFYYGRKP